MFRSTTKIYSLLESLPQDPINEIYSHLEYKQLTKLRVNKYMNALIEETPAGKKARKVSTLTQQVHDVQLLKRIIAPTMISSLNYVITASTIMASLIEYKVLTPDKSLPGYMKYLAFDAAMSAIFAASLVRIHCGYHYRDGYATAPSMMLGAITMIGCTQGGLIGYKSAKFIADIAHLPKEFQYAGAWLGLAVGAIAGANAGILAMKGQHVFSLFHHIERNPWQALEHARELRKSLG